VSGEWGPWVEHDGKGCPCVGLWVKAVLEGVPGRFFEAEGEAADEGCWRWVNWHSVAPDALRTSRLIRYRIRKPKGMAVLEGILAGLRDGIDA